MTRQVAEPMTAPILVVAGWHCRRDAAWLAAFTLAAALGANRFWPPPPGHKLFQQPSGFFDHLGSVAAFTFVGLYPDPNRTSSQ